MLENLGNSAPQFIRMQIMKELKDLKELNEM